MRIRRWVFKSKASCIIWAPWMEVVIRSISRKVLDLGGNGAHGHGMELRLADVAKICWILFICVREHDE